MIKNDEFCNFDRFHAPKRPIHAIINWGLSSIHPYGCPLSCQRALTILFIATNRQDICQFLHAFPDLYLTP